MINDSDLKSRTDFSGSPDQVGQLDIDLTELPSAILTQVPGVNPSDPTDGIVQRINPAQVRLMRMPNRDANAFESSEFEDVRDAILAHGGNAVPICVVELEAMDDEGFKYELIFGARRLAACKMAQVAVLAVVKKHALFPTEQRYFSTLQENLSRKNLSPFELGRQLRHMLDEGHALSARDLSRKLGLHHSYISQVINLARLPVEVVNSFSGPADLQPRYEKRLLSALAENRDAVLQVAKNLGSLPKRLPAKDVLNRLVEAGQKTRKLDDDAGVGRSDNPLEGLLTANGKEVGRVTIDGKRQARIVLIPALTDKQQSALLNHMNAFVKRHFTTKATNAESNQPVKSTRVVDATSTSGPSSLMSAANTMSATKTKVRTIAEMAAELKKAVLKYNANSITVSPNDDTSDINIVFDNSSGDPDELK